MQYQTVIIISFHMFFAGAQLVLTSDPDSNGSYCPGPVTFTCIGTSVSNGVSWVINDTTIYTYNFQPHREMFETIVSNFTVAVVNASVASSSSINIIFTLKADTVNSILGSIVSCRTFCCSSSNLVIHLNGTILCKLILKLIQMLAVWCVTVLLGQHC